MQKKYFSLFFLIIALIVFIVNFFVKANKEKVEAQTPKTAKPDLPEPWEVEETLPPLPPIFQNPYSREQKADVAQKRTPRSMPSSEDLYNEKRKSLQTMQEGMSSLSESLYVEDEMESISYQEEDSGQRSYTGELFHGNITEELKKAIIYSEILHRKYE